MSRSDPPSRTDASLEPTSPGAPAEASAADGTGTADFPRIETLPVGTLLGSYRVVKLLGEGGMGSVYLGEHARIGRRVAIKVLRPDLAMRPDVVARFFGEARSVNQIRHANIIDVYDFVELDRARVFLVMELLLGTDLKHVIDADGPLDPVRAASIGVQIADALMAVHERGIVHRDLKPENIFLIERGGLHDFVKLLDFGIAKLQRDSGEVSRTQTGSVFGTPQYMSPEQARGVSVDSRSDIYSLGMILYTALCGEPAFDGFGFGDIMMKQIGDAPPPLRARMKDPDALPPMLERIVMRALRKEREARFQTMAEIRNTLISSVDGLKLPPTIDVTSLRTLTPSDPLEQSAGPSRMSGLAGRETAGQPRRPQAVLTERIQRPGRARTGPVVAFALTGLGVFGAVAFYLLDRGEPAPGPAPAALPPPSPPPPAVLPAPAPAAVAPVKVTFRTRPDGADVVGDDGEIICRTPCSSMLAPAAEPRQFRARKEGYLEAAAGVAVKAGARLDFGRLEKIEKKAGGRVKSSSGGDTLDPFR